MSIISIPTETPKTMGVLTPAWGRVGCSTRGDGDAWARTLGLAEALAWGEAEGLGEAQVQSASSVQPVLTQRLVPETFIQRRSAAH